MNALREKPIGQELPVKRGAERRRSTREPVVTVGALRTEDEREIGHVIINDVSLHGVGMRAKFALELDELFYIEIGVGPLHLTSRVKVVRVRELEDGTFDIGAEFF
jgi:PilZ domain